MHGTEGFSIGPGGDLLSHGQVPHYHRRKAVSRSCSGWEGVVPPRYGRQAKGDDLSASRPAAIRERSNSEEAAARRFAESMHGVMVAVLSASENEAARL